MLIGCQCECCKRNRETEHAQERMLDEANGMIRDTELQIGVLKPIADAADELVDLQRAWEADKTGATGSPLMIGWTTLIRCLNDREKSTVSRISEDRESAGR